AVDAPEGRSVDCKVSFRRLFEKAVEEIQGVEWTVLLQVLVTRNEAFRTYVLARTDPDTLMVPLLKRIAAATALPIPAASSSSSVQTHQASSGSGHHHRKHSASMSEKSAYSVQKQAGTTILTYTSEPSQHDGASTQANGTPASTSSSNTALLPSPGAKLRQGVPAALALDTVPYVHLYLWLDILETFTEDSRFVEQLQRTTIEFWPTHPHPMRRQPLLQCIVAESLRVFQLNLMLLKDSQVHTQVLAILINVLNGATKTPTAVAQKLVKLFEMIHRRSARLHGMGSMLVGEEKQELDVYEQTLGALLALFCRLAYSDNAQFIYCLLQARELVSSTGRGDNRGAVGVYAAQLRVRVAYFHARISTLSNPLAKEILGAIQAVVAKEAAAPGGKDAGSEVRVAGVARVAPEREWAGFMLPLVWELLAASGLVAVEGRTPLLEEFESMVL
ncbi:hypothetical protein FBU59_004831, partial [Linderina macrospora]